MCHIYFITVLLFLLTITGNVSSYEPEQNCDDQLRSNYYIPGLNQKIEYASDTKLESAWEKVMDYLRRKLCRHTVAYEQVLNITHYHGLPYTISKLGYVELMNIFVANGLAVRIRYDRVHSIIHSAAINGKTDMMYFLVTHDASIGVRTPGTNWAAIHSAAWHQNLDCVKLIYAFSGSPNWRTDQGDTPLHLAAENGNVDIVKQLIRHKSCDQTVRNNNRKTAYDVARDYGHQLIVELLSSN